MLSAERQLDAEVALLRAALERQPERNDLRYDLAERLIEAGHTAQGVALFRDAYLLSPEVRPASLETPADEADRVARESGPIAAALIDAGAAFPAVLTARAWAAAVLGDRALVRRLVDFDRLLQVTSVGLADLLTPDFTAALIAEITAGMTEHELPWSAIRRARRNSGVLDGAGPLGRRLADRLRREVNAYAAALGESDHPFVTTRPPAYRLRGWCVMFDGESRHLSHIHPRAWVSGVLYLQADGVSPTDPHHRGWLRVGPPDGLGVSSGWDERWVHPAPGTLALMPSYFTHETLAAGNDAPRICIAFDVVPPQLD